MKTKEKNITDRLDEEITQVVRETNTEEYAAPTFKVSRREFLQDKLMMIRVIRDGVPYSLFSSIRDYTPFTDKDWSIFLDLSTKSLLRYKQFPKNFKSIHSEKIIEIAEVTDIGVDVFGTMDKFKSWLNTVNFALGNLKPIELLRDSYGKEMVVSELTRINYGILV